MRFTGSTDRVTYGSRIPELRCVEPSAQIGIGKRSLRVINKSRETHVPEGFGSRQARSKGRRQARGQPTDGSFGPHEPGG